MSINVASALLRKRIKNRKLPGLNIPQTGMEEVDRALLQMREYLQMYEGDTKAPKERFVTLDELENAGLIGTATRQGFSSINKVLGEQVDPVKSSDPVRTASISVTNIGAQTLTQLSDSEVDGASPNDFFAYDGSNWVNRGLFSTDNVWTGINRFNQGYIEFQERQASDGPSAQTGRGYLWLEDGQTLYFRDEDGADTDLTAGGGGGGDVTKVGTPVDNEVGVWTGDGTIEGDTNFTWSGTVLELQSVGGTILKLKDNNTTGAGAAVSIIFTDDADTTQATIGTLPVVNVLSLSATGGMLLSAGAGNSVQIDSDTGLLVTGGATVTINDSADTNSVAFDHDGVDFNIVGSGTTDINVTGITSFNVPALASTGAVTGSNLNIANWDTAFAFTDSLTATAAEINLLDLAGLTVGWVLAADSATTASWQAPAGGSNATPLDIIGDINLATPPVAAAFTAQLRFMDNDETDVAAEIGFDGDGAGVVQSLYYRNVVTNGMHIFENDNFGGTPTETLRLYGGRGTSAGQEAYAMANRFVCNYVGTYSISNPDPPLMITSGALEDGQTAGFMGIWQANIQVFTAAAASYSSLSLNASGGNVNIGNLSGGGTNNECIIGHNKLWAARTATTGWNISYRSSTAPSGGVVPNDMAFEIVTHANSPVARMGVRASDDVAYLGHDIHGQPWLIEAQNAVGSDRVMATFHPVNGTSINIPDSATEAMRTATQANGLLEINTDGAGTWERVLTLSDIGGGGDVTKVGTPVDDQVGVWTGDGTIEGTSTFTYDGSVLNLNSVGGTVLVLQDNNSTGGAAAAISMAFHDDVATVLASIGQLPIVDAFSLSSVATMILSTTATNSYLQLSGDVGTRVTGGTYMRFYDSTDAEFMSFANDDTDLLVTATTTAAMRFSGTDLAFNDSDVLRMGTGDDFSMTFNGTNLVLNSNVGSFDIQLTDIDIDLNDNSLIEPVLDDYSVTSAALTVSANAVTVTYGTAQAPTIDLEAATGTVAITVSGGPPSGTYGEIIIKVQQDTTADRTLTWAGGTFVWPGATAVDPKTGSDAITIYYLSTWDTGTTWYISGVEYG